MEETGDWSTYDLVNYLVSIQPTLTAQEFERLRETSSFPKEGEGRERLAAGVSRKVQRYKAKDLYEPIDLFRELGLPIIDWGADNQWDPKSNNGKFLWGLRSRIRVTHHCQLHSQIPSFIGFKASASLAKNSPYSCVGQTHCAGKGPRILLRQFTQHLSRLSPSKFLGSRVRTCSSRVGKNASETI
jgi:hypothetical protein